MVFIQHPKVNATSNRDNIGHSKDVQCFTVVLCTLKDKTDVKLKLPTMWKPAFWKLVLRQTRSIQFHLNIWFSVKTLDVLHSMTDGKLEARNQIKSRVAATGREWQLGRKLDKKFTRRNIIKTEYVIGVDILQTTTHASGLPIFGSAKLDWFSK